MTGRQRARFAMYLAVLPSYRQACIDLLLERQPDVEIFCSAAHLDPSVRTGIHSSQYQAVRLTRFGRGAFLQTGRWIRAFGAEDLVIDLNPRSIAAWIALLWRRVTRRRTLVWGHISPQRGSTAPTRFMRLIMRRLASGTIVYTYADEATARDTLPGDRVWVAPNALYSRAQIGRLSSTDERRDVIYVGRFEAKKRVSDLIEAFSLSRLADQGCVLTLIGGGGEEAKLRQLAADLGASSSIRFAGWVEDPDRIREAYDRAFVSASPGFAGLGLTQSLYFGVPMLVAQGEPHSPEIELASTGAVRFFPGRNPTALADSLKRSFGVRDQVPDDEAREYVLGRYTADAMSTGLLSALKGQTID